MRNGNVCAENILRKGMHGKFTLRLRKRYERWETGCITQEKQAIRHLINTHYMQ